MIRLDHIDHEAMAAAAGLRWIQAARLDIILPAIISTAAITGAAVMTVVHLCRWWAQ